MLWVWIALTGVAATVLVVGWRTARWWRRAIALTAVPLTVLSGSLMLNQWVGYVRSVQSGWAQLTAGPLPNQADMATVTAAREERRGPTMTKGKLVPVDIPADASGFRHRKEIVYLPPAWFDSTRTELPTIMMIGASSIPRATGSAVGTRSRWPMPSPASTAEMLPSWCSSTPAVRSTTTPNA